MPATSHLALDDYEVLLCPAPIMRPKYSVYCFHVSGVEGKRSWAGGSESLPVATGLLTVKLFLTVV